MYIYIYIYGTSIVSGFPETRAIILAFYYDVGPRGARWRTDAVEEGAWIGRWYWAKGWFKRWKRWFRERLQRPKILLVHFVRIEVVEKWNYDLERQTIEKSNRPLHCAGKTIYNYRNVEPIRAQTSPIRHIYIDAFAITSVIFSCVILDFIKAL